MAPSTITLILLASICFSSSIMLFILPHRIANHDTMVANISTEDFINTEEGVDKCEKLPSVSPPHIINSTNNNADHDPIIKQHAERVASSRDGGITFFALTLALLFWAYLRYRFDKVNEENDMIVAKNAEAKQRHKERNAELAATRREADSE